MNVESNSVNVKIKQFENIVRDMKDLISDSEIISNDIQITLHELNDGYTNSVTTLSELFIEANKKKNIILPGSFKEIPVVNSIENYPYPVILLSDDQELDLETQSIVRKRYENGYATFPIIIFSDQFFRLSYGENFSYNEIIKTFEESAKEKVMVFRRNEFKFLKEYVIFIKYIFWIYKYRESINQIRLILDANLKETEKEAEHADNFSGIVLCQRIQSILNINDELEIIDKKFENNLTEWQAEISVIRDKYDRKVLEEITHIDAETISPFVLNIDLKYGTLQGYIKDFLSLSLLNNDYDYITDELKTIKTETETDISTNTAKLSLIGTFSSGKTTLINTFLGEREIPLRTSMGHNTAVLMHLYYEKTDNEYYDIIYKDKLTWSVVKPATMDKKIVNKEKESIRITGIEQIENTNYLIQYTTIKSREQHSKRIRTRSGLAVKRGDVVKPGEPFTIASQQISAMVEICSKPEIDLIIKLLESSDNCKMHNIDKSITDKKMILSLMRKISQFALDKNSTLNYEDFCLRIGLKSTSISSLALTSSNTSKYSPSYRRIDIECNVGRKNERKKLDKNGWINLCGNPDPASDKKKYIFSEQPECYMLAKELQLHVNTEFLQYCSLTDTPGFGSVTEEHDAITERYIRDSSGRLLVMIAINAKTLDAKYQDLINSIDDIYNNFRKTDKKNVIFILNCFTNLTPEENMKRQVENVYQMLTRYGFNKNNIYVCNLKSALVDKKQTETMFGHQSYKKFHDYIITELISSDLTAKYRGIQSNWQLFFKDSKKRINDQISDLEDNLNNIQLYKNKLQDTIKRLKAINVDTAHYDVNKLESEFDSFYYTLYDAYINNRKGIFENVRWNAICRALETVESSLSICNDEIREDICDYYKQSLKNIAYYGESEKSPPNISESNNAIAVLELEQLKKMLSTADDETHWYNKSKKSDYYTSKLRSIIQEGLIQTRNKASNLCKEYSIKVTEYQKSVIHEKESILESLESEKKMKARLAKLKTVRKNLETLESRFGRIRFI